jgi:ankyrin repeat protein
LLLAIFHHDEDHSQTAEMLIGAGADVNQTNRSGQTPLMLAADSYVPNAAHTIELLLDKGADINARTPPKNLTALMVAAKSGNIDAVRTLLARGAAVGETDADGQTAMQLALTLGSEDRRSAIVSLLKKSGAR